MAVVRVGEQRRGGCATGRACAAWHGPPRLYAGRGLHLHRGLLELQKGSILLLTVCLILLLLLLELEEEVILVRVDGGVCVRWGGVVNEWGRDERRPRGLVARLRLLEVCWRYDARERLRRGRDIRIACGWTVRRRNGGGRLRPERRRVRLRGVC